MTRCVEIVEIPESVYQQLARVADKTAQPIEAIAAQSIISNLPPSAEDVLPEFRAELLRLQTLETSQLMDIAQATITSEQFERHAELLERNA